MCERRNVIAFPRVWTEEKKNGSPTTTNRLGSIGCVRGGGGCVCIRFNLDIRGSQPIYRDVSTLTDCVSSDRQNVFFMCAGISMQPCLFAPINGSQ